MPERREKDKMNFNEVAVWPSPGPADPQSKLERIPSLEPEADLAALLAYAASDNPGGASSSPAFQDFSTPHSLPKEGTTETALWQIKPKTHPSPPRFNLQNGTQLSDSLCSWPDYSLFISVFSRKLFIKDKSTCLL